MNPILPQRCYIPDPEARVWKDGRLYLYGSIDIGGADSWCSQTYKVFSTSDLKNWEDHGVSFRKEQVPFATHRPLAAPDCIERDGTYYLYFCLNGNGGVEGVAESPNPWGPFQNPTQIKHTDQIDPAVLIDEDRQAYFYWGQVELKGAALNDDMRSINPGTIRTLLTAEKDGFVEGASIRKINGIYYMLYSDASRGRGTCLSYATAEHPLGPYQKRGVVIDNANCDRFSWNNHGSLCLFGNRWFVFYHRSSLGSRYSRRTCIEPIQINPDGSIDEVEMTTQGADGPIDAEQKLEAYRACYFYGRVHGIVEDKREYLGNSRKHDFVSYKYLDFTGQDTFVAKVRGKGSINIHLDLSFWIPAGTLVFDSPSRWTEVSVKIPPVQGVHAMHLGFANDGLEVDSFYFT